jgi:hypothetical protein
MHWSGNHKTRKRVISRQNIFRLEKPNSSLTLIGWLGHVSFIFGYSTSRSPAISNDRNLAERSTVINAKLEVTQLI